MTTPTTQEAIAAEQAKSNIVNVGAEGSNRAAAVDLGLNTVIIDLGNGRVGKYTSARDQFGAVIPDHAKIMYAEYGEDNLVIPGTSVLYPKDHEEYVNRIDAARRKDPGAFKRGQLYNNPSNVTYNSRFGPEVTDPDAAQNAGFDPFRPYKGDQIIVTDNAKIANISNMENKLTSVDQEVTLFLNATYEQKLVLLSNLNDEVKNKIKPFIGLEDTDTLTVEHYTRYLEEYSTNTTTAINPDGRVTAYQHVNSLQGSTKNRAVSKEMKFNIITGRGAYLQNSDSYIGQDFIVTDRAPLDYIKYLAQQEPWPTVVWQDPRTGEFWYVPRGLDVSGLSDPLRFNRTYFFRQYPDSLTSLGGFPRNNPHLATMLHSFREEESSVSVRTNVLVQSEAPKAMTGNQGNYLMLSIVPRELKGRAYAASFFTVTDNTATQNPGALIAVALSYARVVGKELKAGACTMLGDPSLIPGEAVQIIGSPALQGYTGDGSKAAEDRKKFLEMNIDFEEFYTELPDIIKNYIPGQGSIEVGDGKLVKNGDGDGPPRIGPSPDEDSSDRMFMVAARNAQSGGENTVSFEEEPQTMWRVEAVIDKFNDGVDGYYTEVSLMSCF